MGAKTWMLVCSDGDARHRFAARPALDRAESALLAGQLFPGERLLPLADGSLAWTAPPDDELLVGCFAGLTVLAAREFALDRPTELDARFLAHAGARDLSLHAMHSAVDWLAFARWRGGCLERSLSLSPDEGVIEDRGPRLDVELPFWAGEHPADDAEALADGADPYPLSFHPLELGESLLRECFGYSLEGPMDPGLLDAQAIPLLRFQRKPIRKAWFGKFW